MLHRVMKGQDGVIENIENLPRPVLHNKQLQQPEVHGKDGVIHVAVEHKRLVVLQFRVDANYSQEIDNKLP